MKLLRIWLLVLLAAMVPVRGAMAAAMLCPPGGAGMSGHTMSMPAEAGDAHAHMQHHHAGGAHHDHGASDQQNRCNLCAAFCSLTPLVSSVAGIAAPSGFVDAVFAGFSAPAPSFISDGQERPPRSI